MKKCKVCRVREAGSDGFCPICAHEADQFLRRIGIIHDEQADRLDMNMLGFLLIGLGVTLLGGIALL